jgi:Arc/MetJ-type ribon-helix-helix transcriptional regulator
VERAVTKRYYTSDYSSLLLIPMPVTSFDIPSHLLSFIDDLVATGAARNRREIVVRALEIFVRFQADKWNGHIIVINGIRGGLVSKGSISELVCDMTDAELYDAGRRMGKTLKDHAIQLRIDISRVDNYGAALQLLEVFGWGKFAIARNRISVITPLLPTAMIHGYLESALGVGLKRVETTEDIVVFDMSI